MVVHNGYKTSAGAKEQSRLTADIRNRTPKGRKILAANRGEISVRILRSADELGMRTAAIYAYEDRFSGHRQSSR
jgi:hypothetical protein